MNGTGNTNLANGNVIVGYDNNRPGTEPPQCSLGDYTDQQSCTFAGGSSRNQVTTSRSSMYWRT